MPFPPEHLIAWPGDAFVALSWKVNRRQQSEVTGYQYRKKSRSGTFGRWTDMSVVKPPATGHVISHDIENETPYVFEIRARSAELFSGPSNQASVTPRDRSPRLQEVSVPWYGTAIFASYSEPLLAVDGILPDAAQFRVVVNDIPLELAVQFRRASVKLIPDQIIYAGDSVKVSYTSSERGALRDGNGNQVASFGPVNAWNGSRRVRSAEAMRNRDTDTSR